MAIEPPLELLALQDGERLSFRVERFELGTASIRAAAAPGLSEVLVLRLWTSDRDPAAPAPYLDITSKTTIARLVPLLEQTGGAARRFTLTRHGAPPSGRDSIATSPA